MTYNETQQALKAAKAARKALCSPSLQRLNPDSAKARAEAHHAVNWLIKNLLSAPVMASLEDRGDSFAQRVAAVRAARRTLDDHGGDK